MKENKLTTYLLYAVGEIFLVVVGILIALSLDNWNDNIQKRALEKNYLKEIRVSLEQDVQAIDIIYANNESRLANLDSIFTKMQNRNPETKSQ